jgi:hypothetical protein
LAIERSFELWIGAVKIILNLKPIEEWRREGIWEDSETLYSKQCKKDLKKKIHYKEGHNVDEKGMKG